MFEDMFEADMDSQEGGGDHMMIKWMHNNGKFHFHFCLQQWQPSHPQLSRIRSAMDATLPSCLTAFWECHWWIKQERNPQPRHWLLISGMICCVAHQNILYRCQQVNLILEDCWILSCNAEYGFKIQIAILWFSSFYWHLCSLTFMEMEAQLYIWLSSTDKGLDLVCLYRWSINEIYKTN